jgi:hypothetical protein
MAVASATAWPVSGLPRVTDAAFASSMTHANLTQRVKSLKQHRNQRRVTGQLQPRGGT